MLLQKKEILTKLAGVSIQFKKGSSDQDKIDEAVKAADTIIEGMKYCFETESDIRFKALLAVAVRKTIPIADVEHLVALKAAVADVGSSTYKTFNELFERSPRDFAVEVNKTLLQRSAKREHIIWVIEMVVDQFPHLKKEFTYLTKVEMKKM